MNNRAFVVIIFLLALLIFATACSTAAPATSTSSPASTSSLDGGALVQERCSLCHPLSRVESARFSTAQWKTVVDQMVARGAALTPEEETVVVNWLAANYGP